MGAVVSHCCTYHATKNLKVQWNGFSNKNSSMVFSHWIFTNSLDTKAQEGSTEMPHNLSVVVVVVVGCPSTERIFVWKMVAQT